MGRRMKARWTVRATDTSIGDLREGLLTMTAITAEELSEEDQQLKSELEMLVERLTVGEPSRWLPRWMRI